MEERLEPLLPPKAIVRYSAPIQILLVLLTHGAFAGVLFCGFVNYDDPAYVTNNPYVLHGLNLTTIRWALTHRVDDLYHPLTFLSLALDAQIFGIDPGGFHLDNLLLHCLSVLVLYRLLVRMTASNWRSAWVAAVWSVHPLRVESVAWVTERKDMLMGLFGFLSLHAYLDFVRQPNAKRYSWIMLWLALSLLSKPTLIVMPGLMLLLDFWPLQRLSRKSWRQLIVEKLPIFACCFAALILFAAGNPHFAAASRPPNRAGPLSVMTRIAYGLTSYAWFALTTVRFTRLAPFYPIPVHVPVFAAIVSAMTLAAITAICAREWQRRPWLAFGWGWFVIALLPTIGLLYPQSFIRADRFTYIPSIGLFVLLAWSVPAAWMKHRNSRVIAAVGSGVLILGLMVTSEWTVRFWRDSGTLWQHALAVTSNNWCAELNYGTALLEEKNLDAAVPHFREATRLNPGWSTGHYDYGNALLLGGDAAGAMVEFRKAIPLPPRPSGASISAATLLMHDGDYAGAVDVLRPVEGELPAAAPMLHRCRGFELLRQNRAAAAVDEFEKAVNAAPPDADASADLGVGLMAAGRFAAAADAFEAGLRINPLSATLPRQLRTAQQMATTRPVH